jgi:hypothetical protein
MRILLLRKEAKTKGVFKASFNNFEKKGVLSHFKERQ